MKMNLTSHTRLGKMLQVAAIAVIAASATASVVLADNNGDTTIFVKFNNSGTTVASSSTIGPNGSTLGSPNIRTTNINIFNTFTSGTTTADLVEDTSGAATTTGATLTFTGTSSNSSSSIGQTTFSGGNFSSSDQGFFAGGANTKITGGLTFTVQGLGPEFSSYNLYVYACDVNNTGGSQGDHITVNGQGPLTNSPTGASSYSAGNLYEEFTSLSGASTMTFTATSANGVVGEINGFEIVGISSTPEPSTYALLLGGVLALGFIVRRRQVRA